MSNVNENKAEEVKETKPSDSANDDELDELLDSALEDFDKPAVPQAKVEEKCQKQDDEWSDEFLDQASAGFDEAFKKFLSNSSKSMEDLKNSAASAIKPDGSIDTELGLKQITDDFLSDLSSDLSTNAQPFSNQELPPFSEDDLSKIFSTFGINPSSSGDEATPDVPSLVQNMMQMLLSKDLLYPALKDVTDKYPDWLKENKETIDAEQYEKYTRQYEIMLKVCNEFEKESESDTVEVKQKRFEQILEWMQNMQEYGNPPSSLVGEQGSGLEFDENGLPKIAGLNNLAGMGNEKCVVM